MVPPEHGDDRYSVTWNEAREPMVETTDSVLESFKSMFVPVSTVDLREERKESAGEALMCIIEESEEKEGVDVFAFGRSRGSLSKAVNETKLS